jgi:ADP-ribosyl-[dinitrogen reductase] hydrolase
MEAQLSDRLRGIAVGAAVGDALGMPLEFGLASPANDLIREMRPGRLPAGSFTDDTEMALALAESLLAHPELDSDDLAHRFLDWYERNPEDVGVLTGTVMQNISEGMPWQEAAHNFHELNPHNAGNGSVMRCWPVVIAAWDNEETILAYSHQQSKVTHAHAECDAGCAFINDMLFHLLHSADPQQAYQAAMVKVDMPDPLRQIVKLAPHRRRAELRNTGWVRHTIESALWGLLNTHNFEEALVQVINLGADADTAGTVVGALAGAAYGSSAIPAAWSQTVRGAWPIQTESIWQAENFIQLTDRLAGVSLK